MDSKTYNRTRYDLMRRNTATLEAVYKLAKAETLEVLNLGVDLDKQVFGGYTREVLPPLLDKWGNVAATAAMQHYEDARNAWRQARPYEYEVTYVDEPYTITRYQTDTRAEKTFAAKVVQGRLYQAKLKQFDAAEMANPVVDAAMANWVKSGPLAGTTAAANAMTRQVGAYYRDTMLYNAGLDSAVAGVQRVAHAGACAWCKTLAVGGIGRRGSRVQSYAVHFHDDCKCSIETLFIGDGPMTPPHYKEMEAELSRAYAGDYDDAGMRELRPDATTNETMRSLVQAVRAVERN